MKMKNNEMLLLVACCFVVVVLFLGTEFEAKEKDVGGKASVTRTVRVQDRRH
jgi:uncharacterized protein YabE (DUF348 family)